MNAQDKKLRIIRVNHEIHCKAKIAACQNLLTLQAWVEQLITKELSNKKYIS